MGDALSVSWFVFLTDVDDEQSVTHQVVAGTHRTKTLKELWTRRLDYNQACARYPGRVHTIMGKRGTAWFEDTLVWHKYGMWGNSEKLSRCSMPCTANNEGFRRRASRFISECTR